MSSDFVWHAVEIAEEDACSDCGGHPELCGCDGADRRRRRGVGSTAEAPMTGLDPSPPDGRETLEATSEPAPLAEIDSEAKQPVSMPDEETKRDRPKRACHYCGTLTRKRRRDASGNERTVDHIIPRTLGGPTNRGTES